MSTKQFESFKAIYVDMSLEKWPRAIRDAFFQLHCRSFNAGVAMLPADKHREGVLAGYAQAESESNTRIAGLQADLELMQEMLAEAHARLARPDSV